MRGPCWLKITATGKGDALVRVELRSFRQVLTFAWYAAGNIEVSLWVRPIVFVYVIFSALRMRASA